MFRFWVLSPLLFGLWFSRSSVTLAQGLSHQNVETVAAHLSRAMDTTLQAANDANFVGVHMTTCPVTVTGSDTSAIYLYQEQALSERIETPYRQRFLQIRLSDDGSRVESRTFKPPTPDDWTGFCQHRDRTLMAHQLGPLVCVVSLRPSVLGYVGTTPNSGCPVNLRGAVRLTNTIVLHRDGMDTWDRGFSSAGDQVWGAETEPYEYRWAH
ncbi:MAG: chromophore lyase CpcT/CpeT [Cyanobacteria bacterium J06642_11]